MKNDPAAPLPECHEGPEAFQRFDALVDSVLAVPHAKLVRRGRAYRKEVEANPNRRVPKRALRPPASHAPGADRH
jgi:hypothetical protein